VRKVKESRDDVAHALVLEYMYSSVEVSKK